MGYKFSGTRVRTGDRGNFHQFVESCVHLGGELDALGLSWKDGRFGQYLRLLVEAREIGFGPVAEVNRELKRGSVGLSLGRTVAAVVEHGREIRLLQRAPCSAYRTAERLG